MSLHNCLRTEYPKRQLFYENEMVIRLVTLTLLVIFLNRACNAECWNWYPTTAIGEDFLSSVWKIAWLAVTNKLLTFTNMSSGSAHEEKEKFVGIFWNLKRLFKTNLHWMALNKRNFVFQYSAAPQLVCTKLRQLTEIYSRMALCKIKKLEQIVYEIACNCFVIHWRWVWNIIRLLEVHPSCQTATCCQKCRRYAKSLIKFIPINKISWCYRM